MTEQLPRSGSGRDLRMASHFEQMLGQPLALNVADQMRLKAIG
jgi:hypothetical protein